MDIVVDLYRTCRGWATPISNLLENAAKTITSLRQDKDCAWQNVRILEKARQEQDKKYATLVQRLLEGSDGVKGDWMVSEITNLLETLK